MKAAKDLVREITSEHLKDSARLGYRYIEFKKIYGGIEQRWLLVESETRRESDLKALAKKIKKDATDARKKLRELKGKGFACIPDARKAAEKLLKKSKYHHLTEVEIKAVDSLDLESNYSYQVVANVSLCLELVKSEQKQAGRFILATNVLDEKALSSEEMLSKYKKQQSTERGFKFLKDPMFLTDSVFLKSPEIIEALGLIMGFMFISIYYRSTSIA